jgi:hypothetical protein
MHWSRKVIWKAMEAVRLVSEDEEEGLEVAENEDG